MVVGHRSIRAELDLLRLGLSCIHQVLDGLEWARRRHTNCGRVHNLDTHGDEILGCENSLPVRITVNKVCCGKVGEAHAVSIGLVLRDLAEPALGAGATLVLNLNRDAQRLLHAGGQQAGSDVGAATSREGNG